ncbi:MAG: cytochrome c-type biogenesis CcmF C-terminal domain-containing protein, partial [Rhodanobacteraceae bacterium]
YDKPFVRWIWAGGLLMMLGGFCAASDKRFRLRREAMQAADAAASAPRIDVAEQNA